MRQTGQLMGFWVWVRGLRCLTAIFRHAFEWLISDDLIVLWHGPSEYTVALKPSE